MQLLYFQLFRPTEAKKIYIENHIIKIRKYTHRQPISNPLQCDYTWPNSLVDATLTLFKKMSKQNQIPYPTLSDIIQRNGKQNTHIGTCGLSNLNFNRISHWTVFRLMHLLIDLWLTAKKKPHQMNINNKS